jgi:hypothetical protein
MGSDHRQGVNSLVPLKGAYMSVIYSVGCDSRIQQHTKDRINPIFCAVSDAAVASNTENHSLCKQTFT